MLTIAQITDLHVAPRDSENRSRNEKRLRTVLKAIHDLHPRPAAIIATGDLADTGTVAEYADLAEILRSAEVPVYLGAGNHDRRAAMLSVFGAPMTATDDNGFIQFTVEIGGLRLVMCDTLDEGEEGGGFCEARARWLAETLDAAPRTPTVVALHHPPILSGITWMDPDLGAAWIARLAAAIEGRGQVRSVICGHVHRPFHGAFAGHTVSVSAATALQLTLDMTPVDMRVADHRQILLGEPPGFSLLRWDGRALSVHNCVAGAFPDPITYEEPFLKG
jgi:3',5'-cyclic AMP phosphodiesterase CpdA